MIRFTRITILLPFLCAYLCYAQSTPTAEEYLRSGDVQLNENDLDGAIRTYTKAIELNPASAEAYIKRGTALRTKGNLDGAIDDFEAAQKIDSEATAGNRHIADSYSNRGYIEMGRLKIELAIADFTKAIQLHADAIHYYRRGQARLIDDDLKGAIDDFNQAISLKPQDEFLSWMIFANRGYALLLQGRESEAQRDFDRCPNRNNRNRVLIELHLRTIEGRIKERRRSRVKSQRSVAQNELALTNLPAHS